MVTSESPDWEAAISKSAKGILEKASPAQKNKAWLQTECPLWIYDCTAYVVVPSLSD